MGVPGFFAWLLRSNKNKFLKDKINTNIDYLFLDTNGLIHPQCFKILNENQKFNNLYELENMMLKQITDYIDFIVDYVKPNKMLYIAIDGVAPMAKIKHQRHRRYKSVVDTENINNIKLKHNIDIPKHWSNACITPGTAFMTRITETITEHVKNINCPQVIFSSALIPGEGEHKIMSYIRNNEFTEDTTFGVYGLDADLIFLSLATNKKNIYLLREYSEIDKLKVDLPFVWVSIDLLKECINNIFLKKEIQHEFIINDFIFICYLLGNDFLPNIPSISIYDNGIDKLLSIYCKAYKKLKKDEPLQLISIIENDININFEFLKKIFYLLMLEENDVIREQWKKSLLPKNPPISSAYLTDVWNYENLNFYIEDFVSIGSDTPKEWQTRYYKEYFQSARNIPTICQNYIEGLYWIATYYFIDCKMWKWYYKFDHAPFISTLYHFLNNELLRKFKLKNDLPITPLEQLVIVIPRKLDYLLPIEISNLMTLELSHYCPLQYNIDYVIKKKNWQGVPILPDFDYKIIKNTIRERLKKNLSIDTINFLKKINIYKKKDNTFYNKKEKLVCFNKMIS